MSEQDHDPDQYDAEGRDDDYDEEESNSEMDSGDEEADDWDDELGDIDDLSDPESDLEDSCAPARASVIAAFHSFLAHALAAGALVCAVPVATTEQVPGKQAYLDSCARQRIIPVSAFIKSMGQNKVSLRHYLLGEQGAIAVAESLQVCDCRAL